MKKAFKVKCTHCGKTSKRKLSGFEEEVKCSFCKKEQNTKTDHVKKIILLYSSCFLLLSSCTINRINIEKLEGDIYLQQKKDLVPPSRADKIHAKFYQIDTTKVFIDSAEELHQESKLYMKSKGL